MTMPYLTLPNFEIALSPFEIVKILVECNHLQQKDLMVTALQFLVFYLT